MERFYVFEIPSGVKFRTDSNKPMLIFSTAYFADNFFTYKLIRGLFDCDMIACVSWW